jgi:hypothetical protein
MMKLGTPTVAELQAAVGTFLRGLIASGRARGADPAAAPRGGGTERLVPSHTTAAFSCGDVEICARMNAALRLAFHGRGLRVCGRRLGGFRCGRDLFRRLAVIDGGFAIGVFEVR